MHESIVDIERENDIFEENLSDLKTLEEIRQSIHRTIKAKFDETYERDNRTYLPTRWLYHGPKAVKIAQAVVVRRHSDNSCKGVYICIEAWKKEKQTDRFKRTDHFRIEIAETSELLRYLREAEYSAEQEEENIVLLPAAKVLDNLDEQQRQTFTHLLSDAVLSHRIAELFTDGLLTMNTIDHLAAAAQHLKYKVELDELCEMIAGVKTKTTKSGNTKPLDEHAYQDWFEKHTWVFGTEYIRRINIREIDTHATVDIVLETADGFLDVLELKTPDATILSWDSKHNTYYFSSDVGKVIAQAAKYLDAIERSAEKIYRETQSRILFIRPRVRVVIGRSDTWTKEKHEAFRRLGATLHGIDLMTFDHVIKRAQQLIDRYERQTELETVELHTTIDV